MMDKESLILRLIEKLMNGSANDSDAASPVDKFKGKKCIVRTRVAGVIFGEVEDAGQGFVLVKNARRLHSVVSKDDSMSWYEGVSLSGLSEEHARVSAPVPKRFICEDYELTPCSETAICSIEEFKTNENNL